MSECYRCRDNGMTGASELSVEDINDHIEKQRGMYPPDVVQSMENLKRADCEYYVLPVPKNIGRRLRLWTQAIVQMAFNGSVFKHDSALYFQLSSLVQALSYLVASQSYADNKLYDFDKRELDRKLMRTPKEIA